MVLVGAHEVIAVEIERALLDLQAQLRSAQLKRLAYAERVGRSVRLVMAIPDTYRNRTAFGEHRALIEAALPVPPRRIWAALRSGDDLNGDGFLWIRAPRSPTDKPG